MKAFSRLPGALASGLVALGTWGPMLLALMTVMVIALAALPAHAQGLTLWHAYRGAEEEAIKQAAVDWNRQHPATPVKLLAVPYEAYANKLTSAIPRGHGPDVFIAAHERIGDWAEAGLIAPLAPGDAPFEALHPATVEAATYQGQTWGVPLAYKSLVLFYNRRLLARAPSTTEELVAVAKAHTDAGAGRYGLAMEAANFYMHAPWFFGHGAQIFTPDGQLALTSEAAAASLAFVDRLVNTLGVVPQEANGALVGHLFNKGLAPMAVSGPWFAGEIDATVDWAIAPLPRVTSTGQMARPFLTVELALVSARAPDAQKARALASFLASEPVAVLRATRGRQPVATLAAYEDARVAKDPLMQVFRQQMDHSEPMPNDPRMRVVWEPATQALRQVLRGDLEPELAMRQAQRRMELVLRPPPAPQDPGPLALVLGMVLVLVSAMGLWRAHATGLWARLRAARTAYLYLMPATLAMALLVVVPFVVGSAVSLFSYQRGAFTFVGLANFAHILLSRDYGLTDPMNFYYTLGVTVLWTGANVSLHVALGLGLALVLREPWLRLRGLYRVLLIVPWAIPNYITALVWKGMFHKQFGAINALLLWMGQEPVSWFSQFSTAFAANLATNVWMGFPFMMVVILGALQAIPQDLMEAAAVDGASAWQRFRHITLPLLMPALVPAVVLGTVWTFNMFNIIYLVSGGEPDGATEILISEAYKWAFSRQEQYGYAAAYAVLIFGVLLAYAWATGQLRADDGDGGTRLTTKGVR